MRSGKLENSDGDGGFFVGEVVLLDELLVEVLFGAGELLAEEGLIGGAVSPFGEAGLAGIEGEATVGFVFGGDTASESCLLVRNVRDKLV